MFVYGGGGGGSMSHSGNRSLVNSYSDSIIGLEENGDDSKPSECLESMILRFLLVCLALLGVSPAG